MSLKEDREYLTNKRKEKEEAVKATIQKKREELNKRIVDREDAKAKHEAAVNGLYNFKHDVKKSLIKKMLMELCVGSIPNYTQREYAICENLIENYINEVGEPIILKNMRFSENGFLRTCYNQIDKHFKAITEDATIEPETQYIDSNSLDSFWDDIDDTENVDDITSLIRMRVSDAEENFVNKNQQDKENVKTILQQTASRIQMAKGTNDNDYAEEVEESETRLAKNKIYQIQHEGHRSIFDRMVRNLSEAALKNEDAKGTLIDESGKLDMDAIVESARCMYALLETVSTIQLEKVDIKYIEDTLKSIK